MVLTFILSFQGVLRNFLHFLDKAIYQLLFPMLDAMATSREFWTVHIQRALAGTATMQESGAMFERVRDPIDVHVEMIHSQQL